MGNKENMRQAMKELLGLVGLGEPKEPKGATSGEVNLEEQQQEVAQTMEKGFGPGTEEKRTEEKRFPGSFLRREEPTPPPAPAPAPVPQEDIFSGIGDTVDPFAMRVSGTVIAAGTSVFGDIRAEGDVEVQGKLKGNLEAVGNVRITGKVLGDVKGDSIELVSCAVQGNITAASRLVIDQASIVVGDLIAADLVTDGKVKGSVQVSGAAVFDKRAVLAGNVSAGTVTMTQGAKIQGVVRISQEGEASALFGEGLDI